jgi:hypothetical protein
VKTTKPRCNLIRPMRPKYAAQASVALILTALFCLVPGGGCKKSSSEGSSAKGEEKITGKKSDPPAELKPQWKPGNRYVMHLDSTQTMEMNQGPQPVSQETTLAQDYALLVTNAPDGQRGLELELKAVAVDSHWGERNVYHFDSLNKAVPNQGPGVEMLERIIGGRIWFLLDSNNTVVKVEGIKELIERAQGDLGAGAPDQRRNWMGGMLERVFNADYFKQMVDMGTLPGRAVRIGDTWSRQQEIDVGMVGRVAVLTTNTLRGWQQHEGKKCARIEFNGRLGMKTGKAEGLLALMGLDLQEGRVSGKSWFDPALGLPVETVLEQAALITGSFPGPGPRGNLGAQGTNRGPQKFTSPWRQTLSIQLSEAGAGSTPK